MDAKRVILGFLLCLASVAAAAPAFSQAAENGNPIVGQYVAGRGAYYYRFLPMNPSNRSYATLLIIHERDSGSSSDHPSSDGGLATGACDNGPCALCLVPSKGTDIHADHDEDCFYDKCDVDSEYRGFYRAVSVVYPGGRYRRDGKRNLGISFLTGKGNFWGAAIKPSLFRVKTADKAALQACLCDEIADENALGGLPLALDLFKNVPGLDACPSI